MRERFLLIPRCIAGEWRWLETALWGEKFVVEEVSISGEFGTETKVCRFWQAVWWDCFPPKTHLEM